MIIAVNTRILSSDTGAGKFLLDIVSIIAADNPKHQFVFITENENAAIPSLPNVKTVLIKQQSNNPLLWKLWYNYKLPSALRKINAEILVSADAICSLRTKLPQCLLVNSLDFNHHPEWYDKKYYGFARSNTAAFLQKAVSVISFSEDVKQELISNYKTAANKIALIYPYANQKYLPVHWKEREAVKEKYTNGKEYFLFNGAIHERSNLINLLKAFSLFKKRQKSSMQLIIATDAVPEKNTFAESLRLYKYRSEVKMLSGLDETELQLVTASAYCCINLSSLLPDTCFLLNSMQCEVPVIAGNCRTEILGDAALYSNPLLHESIAEQMMLVFKDENKRNSLIKKGVEQASKKTFANTAAQFWQNILAAAAQ